jgi:suppressor of ftsI
MRSLFNASTLFSILVGTSCFYHGINGFVGEMIPFDWDITPCSMYPFATSANNFYKCGVLEYCARGRNNRQLGYRQYGTNQTCSSPGPLIRVMAGKKYLISFYNNPVGSTNSNIGNISNIHTHGLHISGDGNQDNSIRTVQLNQCLQYVWDIPANHMGGTMWYHSHQHKFSNTQVGNGAIGMLVVEDNYDTLLPPTLTTNTTQLEQIKTFLANEIQIFGSKVDFRWYGNGIESKETSGGVAIDVVQNEWYRIRLGSSDPIQNGGTNNWILIKLSESTHCPDAYIIAFDGVYTTTLPLYLLPTRMTMASRIDIALRCNGAIGTTTSLIFRDISDNTIAQFKIVAGTPKIGSPFLDDTLKTTWSPNRPFYLRDLRNLTVNHSYNITLGNYAINGVKWDELQALATFNYNDLVELDLKKTQEHPFHIHVQHMQIVSGCGAYVNGEFYDTIAAQSDDCIVRVNYIDYAGINLFHCHDLEHEDGGMMGYFNILGGNETISRSNPDPEDYQCYHLLAPGPSPGPAPTPDSVQCPTCSGLFGISGKLINRIRFDRCISRCSWFSDIRRGFGWKCGGCAVPLNTTRASSSISSSNVVLVPATRSQTVSSTPPLCNDQYQCLDSLGSNGYYIRRNTTATCTDVCQNVNLLKFALKVGGWECGQCEQ